MAIYAVTVMVPLVIFVVWALQNPRATPEFHVEFLYPHVVSVMLGMACYFCGAMIIQRQARWWGTRFQGWW